MQKYSGPKDQHRVIERKYFLRIVVGLAIIKTGLAASIFGIALGQATILAPPIGAGEEAVEVQSIGQPSPVFGIVFVVAGIAINLYAINKYRSEYEEIREKEPRPEGVLVAIGLISTLIVAGFVAYIIIAFS